LDKLTTEAKSQLSATIRALRERLLRDILDAAEQDYRLSVRPQDAGLPEDRRVRRRRLEEWLDERVRSTQPKNDKARKESHDRFLLQAVKETAATLINRLALIRHMEAMGLIKPSVVTGGWNSKGYREFREFAFGLLADDTEGYAYLLQMVFDELSLDIPGLFGDIGITRLFRVPASTLREVIEQLDDPKIESAWTDDTTLGWIYQYWNDPEREALDEKINQGGKVEPHEIASKTQMFTERYMVEWLLHNSLGLTWLCMCKKNGWKPDAELVLDDLDKRREEWRGKREKGEVALDELMPISAGLEDRWKYYVPQPIPGDAVSSAPDSIRDLKLLDPACGSGHFLIIAFDLLTEIYREEARHRSEVWSNQDIAEWILERNLFGVDIDPRAIQIAAAGLYLKARLLSPKAKIRKLNLVAPALNLANLPDNDPALKRLIREIREETGIPEELTQKLVSSLAGVDHLGTLLKVDSAVEEAVREYEVQYGKGTQLDHEKGDFRPAVNGEETRVSVITKLEQFLSRRKSEEDLGLRLDGEQLAVGVRFVRIVKEDTYDIVVGNPPYQGISKIKATKYLKKHYKIGKQNIADLYAAFLMRGLELVRNGGVSAMLTLRNWMFIQHFVELRSQLLEAYDLRLLGDFDRGAFEEVLDEVVSVVVSVFRKAPRTHNASIAVQPTPLDDRKRDSERTQRKRAATLCHVGRHEFSPEELKVLSGNPVVYWWEHPLYKLFGRGKPTVGNNLKVRQGLATGDDNRFLLRPWEVPKRKLSHTLLGPTNRNQIQSHTLPWSPYIKGAAGKRWFEPLDYVIRWCRKGLHKKVYFDFYGSKGGNGAPSEPDYFRGGLVFSTIGSEFGGRLHRFASIFASTGCTVFGDNIENVCALFNSTLAQRILESFNPTIHFTNNDVARLPLVSIPDSERLVRSLGDLFATHESHREPSVEFKIPGPSPWRHAQEWAQYAVDRPEDEPLSPYIERFDPEPPTDHVCFAVGVALGRFGANGEGILYPEKDDLSQALSAGIIFLDGTLDPDDLRDSLGSPGTDPLRTAWLEYGGTIDSKTDLRTWLRLKFFGDVHKGMYENRPIYLPLSSKKRTFVAFVSIHRWRSDTLQTLLADHLIPVRRRMEGMLDDLREARAKNGNTKHERLFEDLKKAFDELQEFIVAVSEIAEKGSPPTDSRCPEREADARFEMDLDDGVMINSAALWPLLEPQWKTGSCPKKWWKELATAKGKKDYDWSHLAARYFPNRVDEKCRKDPSLGVAHGCFWKYHPAKAYQWELRLQDEIKPDFTIDEPGSDEYRKRFLEEHPDEAEEIFAKEIKRREKKKKKENKHRASSPGPLFDRAEKGAGDA